MSRRNRPLLENVGSLALLQGANYLLPLLLLPYLVRVLGADNYGLMAFAQAFAAYFVVFVDYGFNWTATREISRHRDDPERVSDIFSAVTTARFVLMAGSTLFFLILISAVPQFRAEPALFLAAFVTVVGSAMFPTWLFQGLEQMKYITIANVGAKALAVLAVVVLVRDSGDYVLATLLQSLGFVAAGVVGTIAAFVAFGVRYRLPSWHVLRSTFRDGWQVFVSQVSVSLYGNTNVFILGLFAPAATVGHFAIAEKIVRAAIGLSIPISGAIYPRVSMLFRESQEAALGFLRRVARFGGFAFLCVSVALWLGADIAVHVIAGEPNPSISLLVRIMAVLPFTVFLDNIFGVQILLNVGMERQFTRAIMMAGAFSVTAALLLVPRLHSVGSAAVFAMTGVVVLILLAVPVHRAGIRVHTAA